MDVVEPVDVDSVACCRSARGHSHGRRRRRIALAGGARMSTQLAAVALLISTCSAFATSFTPPPSPAGIGVVLRIQDAPTTDALTGSKLWLPPNTRRRDLRPYRGGRGQDYTIGDNMNISLLTFDPAQRSLDNLHSTFQGFSDRRIDGSQSWKQHLSFALVGTDGNHSEFTIDMTQQGGEVRGLSIVISRADLSSSELSRLQSIARRIRASYQAFPTVAAPPQPPTPAPSPQPPSAAAPPSPSPPKPSTERGFELYDGAELMGEVLLESRSGIKYTDPMCAAACAKAPQCMAYTRYPDGRCVLRKDKGQLRPVPSPETTSGARSSGGG